jgi:hypothetical protein
MLYGPVSGLAEIYVDLGLAVKSAFNNLEWKALPEKTSGKACIFLKLCFDMLSICSS